MTVTEKQEILSEISSILDSYISQTSAPISKPVEMLTIQKRHC